MGFQDTATYTETMDSVSRLCLWFGLVTQPYSHVVQTRLTTSTLQAHVANSSQQDRDGSDHAQHEEEACMLSMGIFCMPHQSMQLSCMSDKPSKLRGQIHTSTQEHIVTHAQ